MIRPFLVLGVLVLAGCATAASGDVRMAQACEGYSRALGVAADFRPRMSQDQVEAISATISVVPGLCRSAANASETDLPFDYVAALDTVAAALATINRTNAEFAQ